MVEVVLWCTLVQWSSRRGCWCTRVQVGAPESAGSKASEWPPPAGPLPLYCYAPTHFNTLIMSSKTRPSRFPMHFKVSAKVATGMIRGSELVIPSVAKLVQIRKFTDCLGLVLDASDSLSLQYVYKLLSWLFQIKRFKPLMLSLGYVCSACLQLLWPVYGS